MKLLTLLFLLALGGFCMAEAQGTGTTALSTEGLSSEMKGVIRGLCHGQKTHVNKNANAVCKKLQAECDGNPAFGGC